MRLANIVQMRQSGEVMWAGALRDFLYRGDYSHSERRHLCKRLRENAGRPGDPPAPTLELGFLLLLEEPPAPPEPPTEAQTHAAILAALARHQGCSEEEVAFEPQRCRIIEGFVSDGPGWCGNLAWVVHGEACFQTVLRQTGRGPWQVLYEITDQTEQAPA